MVMKPLTSVHHYFEQHARIALLFVVVITAGYFGWLQAPPNFGDPDAFYHIQMAKLMTHTLVVRDFPYLQSNFLQHNFVDQHFLYHVILLPFIQFFPDWIGAKVAQALLGVMFIAVFYLLLKGWRASGAVWVTLLLLWSESFVYRLNLVKAQPLSLLIIFVAMYALIKQKHWWLFPLAWVYVWTYGGWIMILFVSMLYVLVDSFMTVGSSWPPATQSWVVKCKQAVPAMLRALFCRQHVRAISIVIAGLILGLVVNPYFPLNLKFYWVQVVQIGLINLQDQVRVGAEWYPYEPFTMIKNSLLPFSVLLGAGVVFGFYRKKMDFTTKFFFTLSVIFFFATLKARRNIEYFIPVAVFFSALVFTRSTMIAEFQQVIQRLRGSIKVRWIAGFFIAASGIYSVSNATNFLQHGYPHTYGQPAAEFLQTHSKPGQIVFNVSWDMFPLMFYHDSRNYYLVGLDPTFTYIENPGRYALWYAISSGRGAAELSRIKTDFHAEYVWVDQPNIQNHRQLIQQLNQSTLMTAIYQDNEAIIYQVQ